MEIVWQNPAIPPMLNDYIFLNGRRHVRPYYFEFIAYVKNRWTGKTIIDLFSDEFKGRPYGYYVSAIKCGRIQVDGETVPISYILKNSQKISHFVHRHEPPVIACGVSILHEEPDVLAVCKPATVPVHPCGQYRKNTVIGILQAEHGLTPLFPIHRLDRLVSGLLIFARSSSKADTLRKHIEAGMVHKQYIAKVVGIFPEGEQVVSADISHNEREKKSSVVVGDHSSCNPLKGKDACTKFTFISTNGTHSLVLCTPITGRTHQIRVHLQYIGHPIANDMLYLSIVSIGEVTANEAALKSGPSPTFISVENRHNESHERQDFSNDPMCTNCPYLDPYGYEGHEEGLWLHCIRYSGPDWAYECPYPEWASLT